MKERITITTKKSIILFGVIFQGVFLFFINPMFYNCFNNMMICVIIGFIGSSMTFILIKPFLMEELFKIGIKITSSKNISIIGTIEFVTLIIAEFFGTGILNFLSYSYSFEQVAFYCSIWIFIIGITYFFYEIIAKEVFKSKKKIDIEKSLIN